jgi:protein arginine kinase
MTMNLDHLCEHVGSWLSSPGPDSDVVISSRARLARNINGFRFSSHADGQQQEGLVDYLREKVLGAGISDDLWYFQMDRISPLDRELLTERHLISRQLADETGRRGVVLKEDETIAVMINEEDHLRLQALAGGMRLRECYESVNHVDDCIEKQVSYAFSPELGYLTACPTNVGTGIRVSVMLHLPGLKIAGHMEKVFRAIRDMHLAVRGLYGEGSEPIGDIYQLSNQVTLGKSEEQIVEEVVTNAVQPVVEYERKARQKLMEQRPMAMDDKIFRAAGILRHARLISSEEAMYMLSHIRLGIHLQRIRDISLETVNRLFLLIQPAHLQKMHHQPLDAAARDEARAEFIRKNLG